ncbi:MAG: glycosyltransferase family 39 protein, partial [Chloroflexota bacterium]
MKRQVLPLTWILLAFALRMAWLAQRPIWYDEAFSVLLAERDLAAIVRGTATDVQPLLYYFLLHVWLRFGENVFWLRFLSVALSLLVVALTYALARRLFSERAGAFALLFAALAPFQIYHAQELRMYALFALGALLYMYGVSQPVARRWRRFVLLVAGAVIALYAHSLAVLTLVAANVYLLFKRAWREQFELLAAQGVALLAFAP